MTQETARSASRAEALHRQAVEALVAGRLPDGIALLEKALLADPSSAAVYIDLGTASWQSGKPEKASRHYARAVKLAPQNPFTLNAYGAFLLEQRRLEEAEPLLRRAYALKPDHYEIANNLGLLQFRRGNMAQAEKLLLAAIRLNPAWSNARANLGNVLRATGRVELAEKAFRDAIRINPENAAAWGYLGELYNEAGRVDEASDCLKKAIALDPSQPRPWMALLALYEVKSDLEEAEKALEEVRKRFPESPGTIIFQAKLLKRQKKTAEAISFMEKYKGMLKKEKPAHSINTFFFELGQLYDRENRADEAFDCFLIANKGQRQTDTKQMDPAWCPGVMARFRKDFTPALAQAIVSAPAAPDDRPAPVFLVGFPRSGTTLLDQILSSHPGIRVVEEEPVIDKMVWHLANTRGEVHKHLLAEEIARTGKRPWHLINPCYPACLGDLRPAEITELRRIFYEGHGNAVADGKIFVDKMPLNLVHVPILRRVFPTARYILALRHPCDSVLSCFMQQFSLTPFMARFLDIEDGARFYDEAFGLWDQYQKLLPLNVHTIRYEDVVADFQPTVAAVLDFLGVGWNDAVLEYDKTALERTRISTPSYHQVTEKIYTRASGRWLRYRKQLEPVLPILEPHILKHGYTLD
ncbi:MAG: sulfotransferase family protein [Alphaproteobacteria bacterium]|nr:MAG: sulfotransferase family protein [Alphaproteobacteria bacterium]